MVSEHAGAPADDVAPAPRPLRRSRTLSPDRTSNKINIFGKKKQQQQQQRGAGGGDTNVEPRRGGGAGGGLGFFSQFGASKDDMDMEQKRSGEKQLRNPLTTLRRITIERYWNKMEKTPTQPTTSNAPSLLVEDFDNGNATRKSKIGQAELSGLSSSFVAPSSANARVGASAGVTSHVTEKTVMVGPIVDFLTADSTLFMFASMAIAIYPTIVNWHVIVAQGEVPLQCVASWLLVSFSLGRVVNMEVDWSLVSSSLSALVSKPHQPMTPTVIASKRRELLMKEYVLRQQKEKSHFVLMASIRSMGSKIKFQSAACVPQGWEESFFKAWSVLNPSNLRPPLNLWEETVDPTLDRTKNSLLIQRLLKNEMFKRVKKSDLVEQQRIAERDAMSEAEEESLDSRLGRFELPDAETLEEFMIVPMMKLRGMDIFMTDHPESEVATHPWLIEQGLRDCPTVIINVLTPWANLLLYFEMPSWVSRLSDLEVLEDDSDDVRALKHFLNGDDEYRNIRLKIIPSVVEGPLAVKVLAPPKRELVVNCEFLPMSYRKFETEVKSGRKLAPAFEIELDCQSKRAMRTMAGILKHHLASLSIDIALLIQKPVGKVDEEPECCLGLWRFNKIDVSTCPTIPDRFGDEVMQTKESTPSFLGDPSVMRASLIVGMSSEEVQKLAMEQ